MDASEYLHLARLSDFNPAKQPRSDERRAAYVLARQLLALDRLTAAREAGYDTAVGYLWPIEASPKNVVLVGGLQGRGLLGSWIHA
jgi:hypothetical protein